MVKGGLINAIKDCSLFRGVFNKKKTQNATQAQNPEVLAVKGIKIQSQPETDTLIIGGVTKSIIPEVIIQNSGKTKTLKSYENSRLQSVRITNEKDDLISFKEYSYNMDGKTALIKDENGRTEFNYDEQGNFTGYKKVDFNNNEVRTYDSDGKCTGIITRFSQEIENAIFELNNKNAFDVDMTINEMPVVRKTRVKDKQTGEEVDAYVTRGGVGIGTQREGFNIFVNEEKGYERIGFVTCGDGSLHSENEVANLYGSKCLPEDKYRGAGTELLKQVAIDNYQNGYAKNGTILQLKSENQESDAFYRHIGLKGVTSHFELKECDTARFLRTE